MNAIKHRPERDAALAREAELREALAYASTRLGDLGASVPDERLRRQIAQIIADMQPALASGEEE